MVPEEFFFGFSKIFWTTSGQQEFFFFFFKCFFVTILVFIIIVFTLSDDEGWMEQGGRRGDLILLESVAVLCRLSSFSCLNQDQAFCVSARLPGPYPAGCEGVVADRYAL